MQKLNDIKILTYCCGKTVHLPAYNESNKETVVLFDKNNSVIQGITYLTDIIYDDISNMKNDATSRTIKNYEEPVFLFYTFYYQVSFHHFLIQLIPKLKIFEKTTYKMIIPKHTYTRLLKDIFNIYGINKNRIILIDDDYVHCFKQIMHYPHFCQWSCEKSVIDTYMHIRNNLNIIPTNTKTKRIYIKRDGISNSENNNSETGINRKIVNEKDLEQMLIQNGFVINSVGTLTIKEKQNLLSNCDIIIIQNGATLCNLLFAESPNKLLVLSNKTYLFAYDYYIKLLRSIYNTSFERTVFLYTDIKNNDANIHNNSFFVDINHIYKYINE